MSHALTAAGGLATLGPEAVGLRRMLEERFLALAAECGAREAIYPPLMRVEDLESLDYFRNFPHLGVLASGLAQPELGLASELEPPRYALPSAACFNVYLALRGERLDGPLYVTTGANCFRREPGFDERRLLGFYMREIVCVGERDAVLAHLRDFKPRVLALAEELGLPVRTEAASDPFFDPDGGRALMARLFPTKEEVVYGEGDSELAIGSLNFHRNFFGERCAIEAGGEPAYSGCVAFGLERWIWALLDRRGAQGKIP